MADRKNVVQKRLKKVLGLAQCFVLNRAQPLVTLDQRDKSLLQCEWWHRNTKFADLGEV